MPKLNVQQNNQNVIQAFKNALAIGRLKGIIASDGNHNFSAAGSNRNLLDNPWFGLNEVINQRGNTSGQTSHNVYCIDRWKTSYGSALGTWSIAEDGITITAASGTYALINQVIDNYAKLTGKTVTCSAMLSDGTIVSGTVANLDWNASPIVVTSGNVRLQLLGQGYFRVTIINGGSATIRAVKLELGSVSTLANDTPPNYGEELRKCMRYFVRVKGDPVGNGYIGSALNVAFINIPFPAALRTSSPTISVNGSFYVRVNNSSVLITSITAGNPFSIAGVASLRCALQSSVANVQTCAMYCNSANDYIDLSADL